MRVLYFGTYERDYPRNAQVISCLRLAGAEVVEHHVGGLGGAEAELAGRAWHAARLAAAELRLLRRRRSTSTSLVVGYPGPLRPPRSTPSRRRAAGRLQPARLALRHVRRRPRPFPARVTRGTRARGARPPRAPRRRPRRRGHAGERRPPGLDRRDSAPRGSRSASSAPRTASSSPAGLPRSRSRSSSSAS